MWDQLEPTGPHVTYLTFSVFLITYALFSQFIRNNLHLSEPPIAVLFGIILGPYVLNWITAKEWGLDDGIMQEVTRIIVGIQCFAVGIELPKFWFNRHWKSVLYFLGPIMTFSWAITALFAYLIFQTSVPTAMLIGACLSPTDPVLSASVLSNSRFSERVPARLKNLLSAESACNDGVSFPFLYIGIVSFKHATSAGEAVKEWFLITILWQCALGIVVGLIIGTIANRVLRFTDSREYISEPSFVVFYLLLAILSIGVGSMLGSDDFLVAFGAGVGFAHDGWFSSKTKATAFPYIIDMILNSGMFVFFGSIIPFDKFVPSYTTPNCGIWQLFIFLILVLLFRRIPVVLAMKRIVPELHTYREALFCGHFGPMGVGALFLAIEARAQLETGTSIPRGEPDFSKPLTDKQRAIYLIWPVICFVVLGSTMVHGLSTLVISIVGHFARHEGERAPLLGQETEGLDAMVHDTGSEDEGAADEESISGLAR
ncbi:hypothetical protein GLAREA_08457 [Glarea lozoyensis ATCC 20868]|uniref:Cation/H+ exchanger transmembrane domain-containing protein n=1 Tax=Glarea lozoyensis (strain ATCC 20868 / MF5171) TaxID=1116229 RepID=S3CH33_GLAL2|nr:uncharacterized protein GLAREA_08457 [Glarea lozoyensis ATCC 20868]EPE24604.1 hypothetical protein GLAREA_08457 [Glarea lozoyensis ATCC 20868]